MSYITNTINSATPGAALYTALETELVSLGFTVEDTIVIGARTHKVLKSAAAGNTRGVDWWLDFSYTTTGAGYIMMAPFEGFDPATNLGVRGPYGANDLGFETTNYSRYGASGSALETNWANSTSHTGLQVALVASSAFVYRIVASRDRVVVSLSNAPTQLLYCGFYVPTAAVLAYQSGSCVPLLVARLASNSNSGANATVGSVTAALTRMPKYIDLSATYVPQGQGWANSVLVYDNGAMRYGRAGDLVHPAIGEVAYTPFGVGVGNNGSGIGLGFVGTLDGVLGGWTSAPASLGDVVAYGGDTYIITQPSSQAAIALKVS